MPTSNAVDSTKLHQVIQQARCAGMKDEVIKRARWCRSMLVNRLQYNGDLLVVKPWRSCAAYLLPEHPADICYEPTIHWVISLPIVVVTAHVILEDNTVRTLARQVPARNCCVCPYVHCTMVKGWSSYKEMASDLRSSESVLIPATRLYTPCTVAHVSDQRCVLRQKG